MAEIAKSIANIRASVSEIAHAVSERGIGAMAPQRERLQELYSRSRENLQGAMVRVEDAVRQSPVRSLLIAAGTGAALGLLALFGRRRS